MIRPLNTHDTTMRLTIDQLHTSESMHGANPVADIEGADPSEPLVLFWHHHQEGAWNKLATATLSWFSFIPNTLSHLTLLSRSLGNHSQTLPSPAQIAFAPGFLLSQLVTYVQAYCVILDCTSTDSHFFHTVVKVQVSCLSSWSLKLCNQF